MHSFFSSILNLPQVANLREVNHVRMRLLMRETIRRTFRPWVGLICGVLLVWGCGYRLYAGALKPLPEAEQGAEMKVADDGTVTYIRDRLEIALRPMSDEELNRQFASASKSGVLSTNPYTFGDWRPMGSPRTPARFTVFRLSVKNYAYPKVLIDPTQMEIYSGNRRTYYPLSLGSLKEYYYPYAVGYAGNDYDRFEMRKDVLQKTLYRKDLVFSGQNLEGYVVFPKLHDDVRRIVVHLTDVLLRFDSWNRPIETLDVSFHFQREVHRKSN